MFSYVSQCELLHKQLDTPVCQVSLCTQSITAIAYHGYPPNCNSFTNTGIIMHVMLTNKVHFLINVLIQFFLSSTCFEQLMFIISKTILYMQPYMACCLYHQQNYIVHAALYGMLSLSSTKLYCTCSLIWHVVFIINKTILYMQPYMACCLYHQQNYIVHATLYGMLSTRLCKQSARLEDVLDTLCFTTYRYLSSCGPGSVVGIETGYGLDGPGIESPGA